MWYVVHYWDTDPETNAQFLANHKFDCLSTAIQFASLYKTCVTNSLTQDSYVLDGDIVKVFRPDGVWPVEYIKFQSILENES
jgi:hypothetical protein